jgi:hypothetical protein
VIDIASNGHGGQLITLEVVEREPRAIETSELSQEQLEVELVDRDTDRQTRDRRRGLSVLAVIAALALMGWAVFAATTTERAGGEPAAAMPPPTIELGTTSSDAATSRPNIGSDPSTCPPASACRRVQQLVTPTSPIPARPCANLLIESADAVALDRLTWILSVIEAGTRPSETIDDVILTRLRTVRSLVPAAPDATTRVETIDTAIEHAEHRPCAREPLDGSRITRATTPDRDSPDVQSAPRHRGWDGSRPTAPANKHQEQGATSWIPSPTSTLALDISRSAAGSGPFEASHPIASGSS